MLSYRHSFPAGHHADVLKHPVQSLIIESLKEKDSLSFIWIRIPARGVISSVVSMQKKPANTSKVSHVIGSATMFPPSLKPT